MEHRLYIGAEWREGSGASFTSFNPADGSTLWQGNAASARDVADAVGAARVAFAGWAALTPKARANALKRFQAILESRKDDLAVTLAKETGKMLWDARAEIAAMTGKLALTLQAHAERAAEKFGRAQGFETALRYKPHGVVAVYGPYNFPAHLPNGHILPALLAGNCVIFKPSELTPRIAEEVMECWHAAELPPGVIGLVQGERETGQALASHPGLDGLFFTGSSATGAALNRQFAETPGKILALELGGNNPLVVHEPSDLKAAVYWTIISAYQTTGQRCTCARRLIVPEGNEDYIRALIPAVESIRIGAYDEMPEPFMGPLVSNREAERLLAAQEDLLAQGGEALIKMRRLREGLPFVSAALLDVTAIEQRADTEWFGPLLQLVRVKDMDEAVAEANRTHYGLSSGIFTARREHYDHFLNRVSAGVVNWNRPLTGSSGNLPFGGTGMSGNHRPTAYHAVDYCAYPVASNEAERLVLPEAISPGLEL